MKKIIISLAIIVVVAMGGWFVLGSVQGGGSSPEGLLKKMQEKMSDVNSAKINMLVNIEGEFSSDLIPVGDVAGMLGGGSGDVKAKSGKLVLEISGAIERKEEGEDPVGMLDIKGDYESEEGVGSLEASIRMLENATYFKLSGLDMEVPDDMKVMVGAVKGAISDKWIKTEKEEAEELGDGVDGVLDEGETEGEKIENILKNTPLFIFESEISSETISGTKTSHIGAKFNIEALRAIMLEDKEFVDNEAKAKTEKIVEQVAGLDINLWIGKQDAFLYKIDINGPIVSEEDGINGVVNISIELSDHGKSVEVVEPETFFTTDEIMQQVMGAMFLGSMGSMNFDTSDSVMDLDGGFEMPDLDNLSLDGMEIDLDSINFDN